MDVHNKRVKRSPYNHVDARFYNTKKPKTGNDYDPRLACFSNYSGGINSDFPKSSVGQSTFTFDGRVYNCVEDAFQSHKFLYRDDPEADELAEVIRTIGRTAVVYALGKSEKTYGFNMCKKCFTEEQYAHLLTMMTISKRLGLPVDWDTRKLPLMKELVHAKFTQNESLRQLLVSTGNRTIIEASTSDLEWGGGGLAGGGQNHLGQILMQLRTEYATNDTAGLSNVNHN